MEILDNVIEQLKNIERDLEIKELVFPIRRQIEAEKVKQLKQGTRIQAVPKTYRCPYCIKQCNDPEKFFLHVVQVHLGIPEEIRGEIDKQEAVYEKEIEILEKLLAKYTEVLLDVEDTK